MVNFSNTHGYFINLPLLTCENLKKYLAYSQTHTIMYVNNRFLNLDSSTQDI